MIDFRYHLVSLVSVFLALAIGVVLGAGPLRGALADTLNKQVAALREDKANLQKAVENRDATIKGQDNAIVQLGSTAVAGRLNGHSIVQVVLPGAEPGDLKNFNALLTSSGASVTGTITVTKAYSAPSAAAARASALTALSAPLATLQLDPGADEWAKLGALLARGVSTKTAAGEADETATSILKALQDKKLAQVNQANPKPADLVVVFAADPKNGAGGTDADWRATELEADTALVQALDEQSAGTVVVGPQAAAGSGGLIAAVDSAGLAVTSIDTTGTDLGSTGVVLGLLQQLSGDSGHYGTASGATAVLPEPSGTGSSSATSSASATTN